MAKLDFLLFSLDGSNSKASPFYSGPSLSIQKIETKLNKVILCSFGRLSDLFNARILCMTMFPFSYFNGFRLYIAIMATGNFVQKLG